MPAHVTKLIAELDRLLEPDRFDDYGPNGLQVPGREEIGVLVTGVSAHLELFERAREADADLILVHHGLFWGGGPGPIDRAMKRRLAALLQADIGLAAYHLPLDAHPELGNNALLAAALGAADAGPFGIHRGSAIGRRARFDGEGITLAELRARLQGATAAAPLVFDAGPARVRDVGIASGAGSDFLPEAIDQGLDAFITGEPAERVMAQAREGAIHFLAGGHHATERLGVRRLGDLLAERFDLRHLFIDVPNPI